LVTIGGLNIPLDSSRVEVYIGDVQAAVVNIQSNDDEDRAAIIEAEVPPITQAGQYNVIVRVQNGGLWEQAVLQGGLVVDAPIEFESLTPGWGPVGGGTVITIT